ncbi:TolC family protein [Spongiibacter sp. KMU-166]|uniref:TolC family protein n=1 Tax=Spongiibacter thalassae TaxID=2721624 RepID=A0ABX1GD06_9GAMM|nr:TolC family protein [Spongiibacter thalassae]NKI17050.1 TolC family protein [Spongiibacter thalassae]
MKKVYGALSLAVAVALSGASISAMAQDVPAGQAAASPESQSQSEMPWAAFLEQLREVAMSSPAMMAESSLLEAERQNYYAERGDLGLNLSVSHTRFPESSGSEIDDGAVSELEEYSEARLSLDLMHLLARRGSAVDGAKARVESAEYEMALKANQAAVNLMEDAVTAWTYRYRREALRNALAGVESAKGKLRLSESAAMPEITKATPVKVAEAIILHSEVKNKLDSISPLIPNIPTPPGDFSMLPLTPPSGDEINQVANQDLNAQRLRAESMAFAEEAESLRGNGMALSIFGGYVERKSSPTDIDSDTAASTSGPQYGVQLNIPLGSRQYHQRRAAEYQAHAATLGANAAVRQSQRALVKLRDQWAESVARLNQAQEYMRQQATLLSQMKKRSRSPGSGRAPEPWEVDMQETVFWNAVADVWEERAQWIQNALTWGLLNPQYLHAHSREPNPESSYTLCAPYGACEDIAGL